MATTSRLSLVERIVGPDRLRELLADTAVSFDQAARMLQSDYGIIVSRDSLKRWAADIGLPPRSSPDPDDEGRAA